MAMVEERQGPEYRCAVCYAVFQTEDELAEHSRAHGGPQTSGYRCSACGAVFNTEQGLTAHMERHVEAHPIDTGGDAPTEESRSAGDRDRIPL